MTAKTHLWIAAGLVGIASAAAGAESAGVLLEKGIYQEETVGNLAAAAKIYRQILDQARADRPSVAEAQLRLGMCLLKQGKRQGAGEAFRRVVDRFADQQQIAARARKQLERLFPGAGGAGPVGGVRLGYVDDSAEGKWSLGGSGHAVAFQRGGEADKVVAIRIFAARYGHAQAPEEDFHVYLLDADGKVIADLRYPYGLIERGDMRWYTLRAPGTPVPERFQVALSFRPHRTKGVYLGYDKSVAESHSYKGLPEKGFEPVGGKYDWMVRVFLSPEAAPAVAATSPKTFADDVPASLKAIAVTFDRQMMDKSWSWTMYGDGKTFPPKTGQPSYDRARRTCSLPVKLQPGRVYWVGINSAYHHYFQTPTRIAARPHVILFATRSADGKPTAIPEDMLARAKAINSPPAAGRRPAPRPLKLLPAPWPDGEVARLDLTSQTGLALGTIIYTAQSVEVAKAKAWRIESRMIVPLSNMWQFTRVDAKAGDMAPIAARTMNSVHGDFRAEYGERTVTWTLQTPKKKDVRKVDLTGPAFDNEQGSVVAIRGIR